MHAYFPALNSFPSLLGDMLADAIGCLGFTWVLLQKVTNFLLNLIKMFSERHQVLRVPNSNRSSWIGWAKWLDCPTSFCIPEAIAWAEESSRYSFTLRTWKRCNFSLINFQTTASESTFVSLLAGRTEAIRRYKVQYPDLEDAEINSRLVGYCSDQVTTLNAAWLKKN